VQWRLCCWKRNESLKETELRNVKNLNDCKKIPSRLKNRTFAVYPSRSLVLDPSIKSPHVTRTVSSSILTSIVICLQGIIESIFILNSAPIFLPYIFWSYIPLLYSSRIYFSFIPHLSCYDANLVRQFFFTVTYTSTLSRLLHFIGSKKKG
jgi:hypothetical protein